MTTPHDFVHLHVHSQYSILDGQASIQKLVDKAMRDGQPGIALTDHGNMFGIKEFYNYVKKVKGNTRRRQPKPRRVWRRSSTARRRRPIRRRSPAAGPNWPT